MRQRQWNFRFRLGAAKTEIEFTCTSLFLTMARAFCLQLQPFVIVIISGNCCCWCACCWWCCCFFFICLLLLCLLLFLLSVNDCTHCCCSGSYVYRNKITRGNSITDFHLHLPHQFPLLGREEKTFSLLPMAKVEKRAVTYFFCINTH